MQLGDPVIALGYPLRGSLTSDLTVTSGHLSALGGVLNDTRFLQISAPIRPTHSGGPVLDTDGRIAGVVAEKNNGSQTSQAAGYISKDTNFAIKVGALRDFLDNGAVSYQTADGGGSLKPEQIVSDARAYTVLISCKANEDEGEAK